MDYRKTIATLTESSNKLPSQGFGVVALRRVDNPGCKPPCDRSAHCAHVPGHVLVVVGGVEAREELAPFNLDLAPYALH